jgi:DNA-binding SARP family transcriptional activator
VALEITLTGDVTIRATDAGAPERRRLGSAQARVALAVLTLERQQGVTRDALAEAVWPDELPSTWASALRTVVSRVRAFVAPALPPEPEPVEAHGGRYRLQLPADVLVDVELAEGAVAAALDALATSDLAGARRRAGDAADTLRAPFLPDCDGEWVTAQRSRLAELLVTGLEVASQAAAAAGDGAGALVAANEAVGRAPLRESAHRCVMAAHAAGGNRAEALRAYQKLRRLLAQELGVDPAQETEAAYIELLGPTTTRAPGGAGTGTGLDASLPAGLAPGSNTPFVGRDAELDSLAGAWDRATAGARQLVLVTGETGIGKTRLATEAAQRVTNDGGLVLIGRCDREAIVPYQPFVELLDGFVAAIPDDELPPLSDAARAELAAVFPSFEGPPRVGAQPDRAKLFDAVTELVVGAAFDRPVLAVLDDLQWADEDTLLLLRHLLRHAREAPLLVVAISRSDLGPDHPLGDTVRALDRDGWLRRLPLGGLDEADVRALVQQVLPDTVPDRPGLARTLTVDTSGNPFLVVELLRGPEVLEGGRPTRQPIPPGVNDLVTSRLATLSPTGRDLLRAAAVAGRTFELDVVGVAAGLDEVTALDALDAALASGLVVEIGIDQPDRPPSRLTPAAGMPAIGPVGSPITPPFGTPIMGTAPYPAPPGAVSYRRRYQYRFAHDIVQRTLYLQLSGARRRHLHARLADAIEALRADDLSAHVPVLAYHRSASAGPTGDWRAVKWARAAAAQARERRAPSEVLRLCWQALQHVPPDDAALRAEVTTELGLAQVQAGDPGGEETLLDGAVRARMSGRLDLAARAALGLADLARSRTGLRAEAATLIDEVLRTPPPRGATAALDLLVRARLVARQIELGQDVASDDDLTGALAALRRQLAVLVGLRQLEERLTLAEELATTAGAAGDRTHLVLAAHHRATIAAVVGDRPATDGALEVLAKAAAAEGTTPGTGQRLLIERAVTQAVSQGRFTEAVAEARAETGADARDATATDADEGGVAADLWPPAGSQVARQLFVARWLQGDLARDGGPAPEAADSSGTGLATVERALVALDRGDRGRARVSLHAVATGVEPLPEGDEWLHAAGLLGLAAAELGDPAIAAAVRSLLAPHAELVCGVGYRTFVGTATFHLGRLAALTEDLGDAERHLMSALSHHTAADARPWVVLSKHALAGVLEARGRSSDRDWVDGLRSEARWQAQRLGMRELPEPTADSGL